jgi:hypothetical protein
VELEGLQKSSDRCAAFLIAPSGFPFREKIIRSVTCQVKKADRENFFQREGHGKIPGQICRVDDGKILVAV